MKTKNKQTKQKNTKAVKKNKIVTTSGWEKAPNSITINGVVYEKTYSGLVDVELDLDKETISNIREISAREGYASDHECVRSVLRQFMEK